MSALGKGTVVAGGDDTVWGRWNRGWTSEENRHGDLLNKFLYLSGAVDMHAVEQSVQVCPPSSECMAGNG